MSLIGPDFRAGLRAALYQREPSAGLWPSIAILVGLAVINQIFQIVLALCIQMLAGNDIRDVTSLTRSAMLGILPAALLTIAVAWLFAGRRGGEPRHMLRLRTPDLGVLGWATVIIGFLIFMYVVVAILVSSLNLGPENVGDVENVMKSLVQDSSYPLIAVGIVMGAPLAEELTFRGQGFTALSQTRLGFIGTALLTSALWASLHFSEPLHAMALLFVMGLALSFLLVRFGSLWVPFVCHAVWNGIFALSLLLAGSA